MGDGQERRYAAPGPSMDPGYARGMDLMGLYYELGEICGILMWPAGGAAALYLFWAALTSGGMREAAACLVLLACAEAGLALGRSMARKAADATAADATAARITEEYIGAPPAGRRKEEDRYEA